MGTHSKENVDAEQMRARLDRKAALLWGQLDMFMEETTVDELNVMEIRIQGPLSTGGGWRAIIKSRMGGDKFVAFHNAEDSKSLIAGVLQRQAADGLRWKADMPYFDQHNGQRAKPSE